MGFVTEYSWNSAGQLLSESVIVSSTDTRTTSYTWTSSPGNATDPPAGLISTITDPGGNGSQYQYNSKGFSFPFQMKMCERTLMPSGRRSCRQQNTVAISRGLSITQLTQATGSEDEISTTFTYNSKGYLSSQTNAENEVTSYMYNNLGLGTSIALPAPDGAGSLTASVRYYTYNSKGQKTNRNRFR